MSATTEDSVPQELVVDFDVYDPSHCMPEDHIQEDVAELAAKGPVVWSTAHKGHWIVTSYDACNEVITNPDVFSSYPNFLLGETLMGKFYPLEADGTEHRAYRKVITPLFNPKRMQELEEEVRVIVNDLIDGFIEKGECEWVTEFAHEVPARVFLAQMGLPIEDAPFLTEWTDKALQGKPGGTEEESAQVRMEAAGQVGGYFMKLIGERRENPPPEDTRDVITHVIRTPLVFEDEERLATDEELLKLFFLVLIAGLHTTQGALGWGVKHLSANPEQRQKLIDDPSLLPDAIEEILRIDAPVFPGRSATQDYELGGVQIKQGDQLLLALCHANRDPKQFENPLELDVQRRPNKHLAFSTGRHRCIGAHLARVELRIAFEELHKRITDYELAGTPIFHPSQTRGVVAMPIKFTPGSKQG